MGEQVQPGKPATSEEVAPEIVRVVKQEPPENETHRSVRTLAKRFGLSHGTVHRIVRKHQLKPHLVKRFRTSNDPQFAEKLVDVVGLYMNPPENAIILCVDEKSQIQALERTRPILPLREGIPERQTHDYQRHGVLSLFGAAVGSRCRNCGERFSTTSVTGTQAVNDLCGPRVRDKFSQTLTERLPFSRNVSDGTLV